MKYNLKYTILDSKKIYNYCGPGYGRHYLPEKERSVLVERQVKSRNDRDGFFKKLEASILKDGFRNPITVNAGYIHPTCWRNLPPHITKSGLENFLVCVEWGGSRLYIAQKHNMTVPCLIVDYSGMFSNLPTIKTAKEISELYQDPPKKILLKPEGIWLDMDVKSWEK